MTLRWVLATLGGALLATVVGAVACLATPGPALNGIAVGVMSSTLVWVLVILGAMSTQQLGRFATKVALMALAASLMLAWGVVR